MRLGTAATLTLALLLGGVAGADELDVTTWRPAGLSFTVGGGVGGFLDSAMSDRAEGLGGAFDVRGAFGTTSHLAVELATFGLVQRFDLDLVDEARLLTAGAELDLRLNFTTRRPLQPYVFGGIGWTHANVLGRAGDRAGMDDRKNLAHAPLGSGIAIFHDDFVFDLRGQLRLTGEKENRLFGDIRDARMNTWGISAQLGWHFH